MQAKRVYKNGKIEHEYFQKFIKEIFPFNYTVVHLWNGDVKQILPSGIQIYYSKNSGVTQITSKQNGSAKEICFFPNNDTAQMTVVYDGDAAKNVTEVFCNGHLKRMLADGSVVL
jgi:antitoxin component YwqK of YwqJK toxin-antitoxin module